MPFPDRPRPHPRPRIRLRRDRGLAAAAAAVGACALLTATVTASASAAEGAPATHTVRPGDTLYDIAARTGTSVADIAAANALPDPRRIRPGQVLVLPAPPAEAAEDAAEPAPVPTEAVHVVRPGDTLYDIAARTGTSVADIAAANALPDPRRIRPGQELVLPAAAAEQPAEQPSEQPAEQTAEHPTEQPAAPSEPVASSFAGRTYPPEVTAAATASRDALRAREVPSRDAMRQVVADAATAVGVDPSLALAIAHQESGFDMRAVSPAGAVGAMQVIPSAGDWASSLVGRELDLLDPEDNATAGAAILRQLLREAPDETTAVAAYYQGLAGVRANGIYPDTLRYVANIQALRDRFR
ncbi:LysM peptidoglycan-binding domain-containing protein [Quadrisphaera sp. DSM 44207]|uniref:lytic transglycosylase n=1 Tax=Quadrisphaera sp. DSM 44207 TaxID=1881057 RepID=UPI00088AFE1D|nr:LysM peptidoglycan-binding domain-containing protein [Quadrisphaera sp. DSM 44207]SDQ77656.1 LysM repeat-containing protein [Quadrisphaera sp. DSM 44207]